MEISTKNLKVASKSLNSVLTEGKVRTVGIKINTMTEDFGDAVEQAVKDGIPVPEDAIDYYNLIFAEVQEEELIQDVPEEKPTVKVEAVATLPPKEEKPKEKRKRKSSKKIRAPKEGGVVMEACKLIKANPNITNSEILDELVITFPDRTRKEMYSTVGHSTCIGRSMLVLFGIKVGT